MAALAQTLSGLPCFSFLGLRFERFMILRFVICDLRFEIKYLRTASSPRITGLQSRVIFLSEMAFKIIPGPTPVGSPLVIAMVGFIGNNYELKITNYDFNS